MKLWTIGHSTLSLAELTSQLQTSELKQLADVRTVPRSRHTPQFNADGLPDQLQPFGIDYRHWPALGGWRRPRPDSPNTAWRNSGFRGYADYMQTAEFAAALDQLLAWAAVAPTALMCAEAVPWRCHRSLLADALTVRGHQVYHLIGNRTEKHKLTEFAVVNGLTITYPRPAGNQIDLGL